MSIKDGKVIWIVNHYAGSRLHGMEYRHYYLAQQFRRMGLRPVIHLCRLSPPADETARGEDGEVDGVPYVWIKTCRYEKNDVTARPQHGRVLRSSGAAAGCGDLPRPEVVIASSPHPFVAVNGYRLARKHGAKFIFEVRDLWPLTILEVGRTFAATSVRAGDGLGRAARLPALRLHRLAARRGEGLHGRPRARTRANSSTSPTASIRRALQEQRRAAAGRARPGHPRPARDRASSSFSTAAVTVWSTLWRTSSRPPGF